MKKTICFTIDIEPDFGGLLNQEVYFGKNDLPRLNDTVKRYGIKLTAFVTGKTLEQNPEILDVLSDMRAEVEQHSYSHQIGHESKIKDMERGIEVHEKYLGKRPMGYRAPQGLITKEEAIFLADMGIKFDSSIFPTFFPGRFNRLNFPLTPFVIEQSSILELPFAVIPRIRLPIGLSYMQLMGLTSFRSLFAIFGMPKIMIYGFHSYELGKVNSYEGLPRLAKLGYYRAQRMYKDPAEVLEQFMIYILSRGYESKYMADLYEDLMPYVTSKKWKGY